MSITKQLYQLQEIDLELESNEQTLKQIATQLGESQEVAEARAKLALEKQHVEELKRQQHDVEWGIDDLDARIAKGNEELYSGRVRNPKELSSLQQEVNELKARRGQLEDKALDIMEQAESATARIADINSEIKTLEAEWSSRQRQLSAEMEKLKTAISELNQKRVLLSAKIDPQTIEFYSRLRKQKGTSVARVEQGTCCGCRIFLPYADLQRVRTGSLVQCGSCGRILFLA